MCLCNVFGKGCVVTVLLSACSSAQLSRLRSDPSLPKSRTSRRFCVVLEGLLLSSGGFSSRFSSPPLAATSKPQAFSELDGFITKDSI